MKFRVLLDIDFSERRKWNGLDLSPTCPVHLALEAVRQEVTELLDLRNEPNSVLVVSVLEE